MTRIHPTAQIDSTAHIGFGAYIGPNVKIGPEVYIGDYSIIGSLPEHRDFYTDLKLERTKGVNIGFGARIFEFVTIHAGTQGPTDIGAGVAIHNHSHIAHDCQLEPLVTVGGQTTIAGHVKAMQGSMICGKSAVHQWCVIGAYSILGAGTFLKNHIPPGEKWLGNPARPSGHNDVGLIRANLTYEECVQQWTSRFEKLKESSRL